VDKCRYFSKYFLKHPFYFSLTFACEKARERLFLLFIIIIIFTKIQKKQHRGHRLGSLHARSALLLTGEGRGRAGRDYGILAVLFVAGQGKRAEAREESECNEEFHLDGCLL